MYSRHKCETVHSLTLVIKVQFMLMTVDCMTTLL